MCDRIQINKEEPFARGALVQLSVGVRMWGGFARYETLDRKFPHSYGWKVITISSSRFWNHTFSEEDGYSATTVALPPLQNICIVYNKDDFRVITREATSNEVKLIGKERVPVVRDHTNQMVYFSRHHTYKRVDWR